MAAAVLDVFPGTILVEGRGLRQGFYYDFIFTFSFREEFLVLIEERMRKIIKEKREIKKIEMVPVSAAGFLRHKGQPLRAEAAESSPDTLISLMQIGEHVDYQEFDFSEDVGIVGSFKLLKFSEVGGATRILGTAFSSKEELKAALKEEISIEPCDHRKIGEEMKLFAPVEDSGYWRWLPNGDILRQQMLELLPKTFLRYVHDENAAGEGMLDSRGYFLDQTTHLKEPLQFIVKLFKLCGIKKYRSVADQFLIEDDLGREWPGPYVEQEVCSVFGPMERFVAVMLEQNGGEVALLFGS